MASNPLCNVFVVLCTLFTLHLFASVSSQECFLRPDGTIIWGALPTMKDVQTSLDYNGDGERRGGLSDLARGFVNVVTPTVDPLLDYLSGFIEKLYDGNSFDVWTEFKVVAPTVIGIIICLSVGVLYLILVPIIGIIFGCCRCCNNCGGKRVQEESRCPGCLRVYYTIFLLCITGILCAGMAYTNFSNDFIGHAYEKTNSTSRGIITDIQAFTNGTLKQMEYITNEEYDQVDCLIKEDLNNIGTEIADPLVTYLKEEAGMQEAFDAFGKLTSDLNDTYVALDNIKSSRIQVIDGTTNVESLLTQVKTTYDSLNCTSCPNSTKLAEVADYSMLPLVENQLMQALAAKVLAEKFYMEFDTGLNQNISAAIDQSAQPAVIEVFAQLDTLNKTVQESFQTISDTGKQVISTLDDAKINLQDFFKKADKYSNYRYYGLIGVTCLTLLIVLFNVIGIAMGTFAYKDVLPTERTRMSNAGGNVLIAGVFFSLLFGPILILICMVLFAGSGTSTLSCEPLSSLELFEKTIDKPDFIVDGYLLGDLLLKNSSINLTVSSILTECQKDSSLFTALQFSQVLSLDDAQQELDDSKSKTKDLLKSEIKLPTLTLFDSSLGADLTDAVSDINLGNIDQDFLEIVLGFNVTDENLEEFADKVYTASLDNANIAIQTDLQNISRELRLIQNDYVNPINSHKQSIIQNAEVLVSMNNTLDGSITNTTTALDAAQAAFNLPNTTDKVQEIAVEYVDTVFGYADQFVAHIDNQLENDLGRCLPLRNSYDLGVDLICYYIFDSLNTLWFTTGWCAIFMLFSIFLAVKLAKFYRIMDEEALPKAKKSKKGGSSSRGRGDQEMALEDMSEDGHTGHDNIRLVESIRQQGGMQPQQNPQYIPDDVINGYDNYNNLGRPMAPPPAYHPGEPLNIPPHDYYF